MSTSDSAVCVSACNSSQFVVIPIDLGLSGRINFENNSVTKNAKVNSWNDLSIFIFIIVPKFLNILMYQ